MPWDAHSFQKHNHSLHGEKAGHAARIANAILKRSGDEGMAIATANKWAGGHAGGGGIVPRYDDGGQIDPNAGTGIGGPTPPQGANPLMQNMIQRYSAYPTEKLAELSAQMGGTPQGQMIQRLLMQRRMTPTPQAPQQQGQGIVAPQAPTVGQAYARGGTVKRDLGGGVSLSDAMPYWARREQESSGGSGFLHGATPGQADQIKTQAPPGAYVIPAEVIAGLGQGNGLSGARIMQAFINSGPYGTPLPRSSSRGTGMPRPPSAQLVRESEEGKFKKGGTIPIFMPQARASGGANRGSTPVDLSDGEFVVHPKDVDRFGFGDRDAGHRFFDKWVMRKHKQHIKALQAYRGPVIPKGKSA